MVAELAPGTVPRQEQEGKEKNREFNKEEKQTEEGNETGEKEKEKRERGEDEENENKLKDEVEERKVKEKGWEKRLKEEDAEEKEEKEEVKGGEVGVAAPKEGRAAHGRTTRHRDPGSTPRAPRAGCLCIRGAASVGRPRRLGPWRRLAANGAPTSRRTSAKRLGRPQAFLPSRLRMPT